MLSKAEREEMIDWLMIAQGCTREYWEKQSDKILKVNYRESCLTEDGAE
ncbi:hypothetical protein [Sporolactobacillus terrae]|nr:hypothetical protein [Sporolactobacillus terrae]